MDIRRIMSIAAVALVLFGVGQVVGSEVKVVSPARLENTDGDLGFPVSSDFRSQYLHLASDFNLPSGKRTIIGHTVRLDGNEMSSVNTGFANIKITLSTTTVSTLNTDHASNFGTDTTVVFNGPLTGTLLATGPLGGPHPFSFGFEYETPFIYDPSQGNLLLEYESPSPVPTNNSVPVYYQQLTSIALLHMPVYHRKWSASQVCQIGTQPGRVARWQP